MVQSKPPRTAPAGFATFREFYPYYLLQHCNPISRRLHVIGTLLAIGCVNIAGLLLGRGVKREREMAMRLAIGAGRRRLLGQVLTEGILVALLGAGAGVLLASAMLNLMRAFLIKALERGAHRELHRLADESLAVLQPSRPRRRPADRSQLALTRSARSRNDFTRAKSAPSL